jgi:RNA polymerase sigma factor (sigma-70 family)
LSLTQQNIDTLLAQSGKGNHLAQLEIYNRYQGAMYNVAVRIVKNTAEAEDVMQESFITAFEKLNTFKGDATFGVWLRRIVINNSISQYNKSKRYVELPLKNYGEEVIDEDGYAEEDYAALKASKVMQTMDELHESYKQILTLHLIEGYDYEEVCDIMQISYANCRTLISRAKESLRNKLTTAS